MFTLIKELKQFAGKKSFIILAKSSSELKSIGLNANEVTYVTKQLSAKDRETVFLESPKYFYVFPKLKTHTSPHILTEKYRLAGSSLNNMVNKKKRTEVVVVDLLHNSDNALAFAEGLSLANYQFLKYKNKPENKNSLQTIYISSDATSKQISLLNIRNEATCKARDLVNEPWSFLNSVQLSEECIQLGKEAGFKVEVLNKKKIESLKMGGLLAVNKGSIDPPTFSVLEWKPKKAVNKKPYVLVGKGVVFDTGGLSLKPTPNSMDEMKCDMAGAAGMAGTMYAIAKAKLPVHVVALIPSTDNRPGQNSYTPGDVIKMHNGINVEVLNTDAEGRMILADALSYASRYKPELVFDMATLTGAAVRAFGKYGIVAMGNATDEQWNAIQLSGNNVYERIIQQPFWDEYKDLIKSEVADIKNIGGAEAGAITAGKFLEYFTDYNWIHLDIAGPAYLLKADAYRGKFGTGTGVRLLFDFFVNLCST